MKRGTCVSFAFDTFMKHSIPSPCFVSILLLFIYRYISMYINISFCRVNRCMSVCFMRILPSCDRRAATVATITWRFNVFFLSYGALNICFAVAQARHVAPFHSHLSFFPLPCLISVIRSLASRHLAVSNKRQAASFLFEMIYLAFPLSSPISESRHKATKKKLGTLIALVAFAPRNNIMMLAHIHSDNSQRRSSWMMWDRDDDDDDDGNVRRRSHMQTT